MGPGHLTRIWAVETPVEDEEGNAQSDESMMPMGIIRARTNKQFFNNEDDAIAYMVRCIKELGAKAVIMNSFGSDEVKSEVTA